MAEHARTSCEAGSVGLEDGGAVQPLTDVSVWVRGDGLEIVLLFTGAILLSRFVRWLSQRITRRIDRHADRSGDASSEAAKHRHALTQVLSWSTVVVVYCVAGILILVRFGVPLAQLAAPAAVVGAALGFGGQRIVRDVLAGFFVVAERQYGFGDVVRLEIAGTAGKTVTGTVKDVTLRVTELRTPDGEVVITPNGEIIQVTNLSRDWARSVIDVPLPRDVDVARATTVLQKAGEAAYADDGLSALLLDQPSVMGVESMEVDQIVMRLVARTLPGKQHDVGRILRARVADALQQEGIVSTPALDTEAPSGHS